MVITEKVVTLKDGSTVTLRSPVIEDAKNYLILINTTNNETHYMCRSASETVAPQDITDKDLKDEEEWIASITASPVNFNVTAWADGKLVGSCGVTAKSSRQKLCHRCGFGIALTKDFCDKALGSLMLETCIEQAKTNGFEIMELSVFDDNSRAKHVYSKFGFTECGRVKKGFKLCSSTYIDEVMMCLFLK